MVSRRRSRCFISEFSRSIKLGFFVSFEVLDWF